ncbi:MAG: GNAT family N-acetyltransferase [Cetobacterium sp.]|uniref:GNAT family N-acetyltransferase n=1 Tax=Cetobacterium sp. TaxID=2071632 RepID=UPI003F2CE813
MIILSSSRINFRKINRNDFNDIYEILGDEEIMYAWEHGFSQEEVKEWIEKNLLRYGNEGYSYFAMIEKNTGKFIGVMGPLIEEIEGEKFLGLAYILNKKYWRQGYGIEGAKACLNYAFKILKGEKVIAQIRPENISSIKVAKSLGMKLEKEIIKTYRGKKMPHLIFSIERG